MTEKEEQSLKRFETRVRQMLLSYQTLQKEHISLQKKYQILEEKFNMAQTKQNELNNAYEHLKMAKILAIHTEDIDTTRRRIQSLIKKVEQCIAMIKI